VFADAVCTTGDDLPLGDASGRERFDRIDYHLTHTLSDG
jgi:hypothetical protein